jgi:hypothetical protein
MRVFVSYRHDSDEHKERVHRLALALRARNIEVVIDRDMLPGGPPAGWHVWSEAQVRDADRVLVACTEGYRRVYDEKEVAGVGLGSACEARQIRLELFRSRGSTEKFRPVLVDATCHGSIPDNLAPLHAFAVYRPADFEQLVEWLTGTSTLPDPIVPTRWPDPLASYQRPLADREAEFEHFIGMVTGQSPQRIMLVQGTTNLGKSALIAEMEAYSDRINLDSVKFDFKGGLTNQELYNELRLDLHLPASTRADPDMSVVVEHLMRRDQPFLLLLDTFQDAGGDSRQFLETLLSRMGRCPRVAVVVGGQTVPTPQPKWSQWAKTFRLQPIVDVAPWARFADERWRRQIESKDLALLVQAAKGEPGLLVTLLGNVLGDAKASAAGFGR